MYQQAYHLKCLSKLVLPFSYLILMFAFVCLHLCFHSHIWIFCCFTLYSFCSCLYSVTLLHYINLYPYSSLKLYCIYLYLSVYICVISLTIVNLFCSRSAMSFIFIVFSFKFFNYNFCALVVVLVCLITLYINIYISGHFISVKSFFLIVTRRSLLENLIL